MRGSAGAMEDKPSLSGGVHFYRVFGLGLRSAMLCPELPSAGRGEDVSIVLGPAPTDLTEPSMVVPGLQAGGDEFLLDIPEVARFHVANGNRIVVEPNREVEDPSIRLFLFGSAFGGLLYQRGVVPFHAGAVEHGGGAVLFTGPSGAGKSTAVGALSRMGKPILADDLCGVDIGEGGGPILLPGIRLLKLSEDSILRIGGRAERLCWAGKGKRRYELAGEESASADTFPLLGIYELVPEDRDDLALERLGGAEKMQTLLRNCYRPWFLEGMGHRKRHFEGVSLMARSSFVRRVRRPSVGFRLDELAELLAEDMAGEGVSSGAVHCQRRGTPPTG